MLKYPLPHVKGPFAVCEMKLTVVPYTGGGGPRTDDPKYYPTFNWFKQGLIVIEINYKLLSL